MRTLSRMRAATAVALAMAVGAAGPSAVLVDSAVAKKKTKKHCVKYKTVKTKKGKKVKRCAKYSK